MHTVFALLCFVVVIHWLIFHYPSGLLHWHCGNLTIAPVPAKQPWWIWINTSCEFIMNVCITTTKQSTTKPCAYFLGYTVVAIGRVAFLAQVWFNHCHTQNTNNGLLYGISSQQHRTVLICIYQMLYVNCTAILWMIILGSLDPRTQVWEIQLIHHWLIKIIIGCELQRLVECNDSSAFSNGSVKPISHTLVHYNDVIMITIGSQITSLTVVYSTVYSDADQRKHQSSASLAFVWGIHRDRWIPRTKGQLRRKCFHLMTSSWWVKYIKNFVPEACAKGRNYIPQILQM